MRAIVLVKQVPDLRAAPVGMRADGTIDREKAAAVTNPADLHAVEAALRLADEVVALSMGPPAADAALREAISLGATSATLVSDRLLAGSDTWATANALAAAIETLGRADIVLCGLSALDGETGQVGPQVATRLGWPQATGCEEIELDGDAVVVRRIVEGGYERLRVPLPAVLTVAETGFEPRYPTLAGRRRAASGAIEHLGASDIGVDEARVGLAASPTKVAHMEAAPLPDRSCRFVGTDLDVDELVAELDRLGALKGSDSTPVQEAEESTHAEPSATAGAEPAVWVVGEHDDHQLSRATLELIGEAAGLAPGLGGGVAAVLLGRRLRQLAHEAAQHGADVVYCAEHDELAPYRAEPYARVLADLAATRHPVAVLFSATTTGRDLAPRLAAMLDTGLAADCTDLAVRDWDRRGQHYDSLLHQIRPAMAGGVLATCVCPTARPQMATVRPGVFEPRSLPRLPAVEQVNVALRSSDSRVVVLDRAVSSSDVDLADADVVIAGGAGCDAASWHLVEDLAAAIGGRVAASRGAVEAGLASRSLQVGQTGTTVHPRLYVACGISGALQHAVGMRSARTVVAVNRDPDAFMFRLAHYGIVGDVRDVLPALRAAFERSAPRHEK